MARAWSARRRFSGRARRRGHDLEERRVRLKERADECAAVSGPEACDAGNGG